MLKKHLKRNTDIKFYRGKTICNVIQYRSNIFNVARQMIKYAKYRVIVTTYQFEKTSFQSQKIFDGVLALNYVIQQSALKNFTKNHQKANFKKLTPKQKIRYAKMSGYQLPLKVVLSTDRPFGPLKNLRDRFDNEVIPTNSQTNFRGKALNILRKSPFIDFIYEYHSHKNLDTNHAKYIIVDDKVLITSSNINDRSYFEAGRIFKGDIVEQVVKNFYKNVAPKFSNFLRKTTLKSSKLPITFRRSNKIINRERVKIKRTKSIQSAKYFIITTPSVGYFSPTPFDTQQQFWKQVFIHVQDNIKILTPNLNYEGFEDDIIGAINRGINIDIILSQNQGNRSEKRDGGTNQQTVNTLYKLYKNSNKNSGTLNLRYFRDHDVPDGDEKLFRRKQKNRTHVKFYIVDDICSIWGSMNLDNQSNRSHELSIGSFSKSQLKQDIRFYNKIFNNHSIKAKKT